MENKTIKRRNIIGIMLLICAVISFLCVFTGGLFNITFVVLSAVPGYYFVKTNAGPIYKQNERILKITFYIFAFIILLLSSHVNVGSVTSTDIIIILYSIGAPWGKNGYKQCPYVKTQPEKVLTKNWWFYVSAAAFLLIAYATAESNIDTSSSDSSQSTSAKSKNYISLDGQHIYYTNYKKYKIGAPDNSWSNATAKINNVTIYKTESGYTYGSKRGRKSVEGMLAINVTVKALKDIDILMNSATVSIPSINEQHDIETKDDWDELDKGMSKTGTVYIPIYKLKNINKIQSLRFKFDCELQNNQDAGDYDHTYDMTVNLK